SDQAAPRPGGEGEPEGHVENGKRDRPGIVATLEKAGEDGGRRDAGEVRVPAKPAGGLGFPLPPGKEGEKRHRRPAEEGQVGEGEAGGRGDRVAEGEIAEHSREDERRAEPASGEAGERKKGGGITRVEPVDLGSRHASGAELDDALRCVPGGSVHTASAPGIA